ncbi:MAG: hypothetical protein HOP12_03330, partial [Candidatus Eisenbacteria bacterium]|nr:hypothetical protein [Candidatus Eisenbacteria bacterium]
AKGGHFPRALYLEGPDEALKTALLAELRRAWSRAVPEQPLARVMRAGENDVAEILATAQGGSLFSTRELLVVLEIEDLGRSEKKVEALAGGLAAIGAGSCVLIHESASETERKSLAPIRAACDGVWTAWPPAFDALVAWGTRRLEAAAVRAEAGVVEAVASACEGDASACFNELEKLATFAGPEGRVTRAEVEALRAPMLDADLPQYVAAVAAGDVRRATQRLHRMLAGGMNEGTVMFALVNLVGGALGGWARSRELSALLARRVGARELGPAMDALYRMESAWKGGRADIVALLELATRTVAGAGAARAAGASAAHR